jgi:hydrogenase expression/formation protein HypC
LCVGYAAKILELTPEIQCAHVEYKGLRTVVNVALIEDVAPGDYVLVHAGVALQKMDLTERDDYENRQEELRQALAKLD